MNDLTKQARRAMFTQWRNKGDYRSIWWELAAMTDGILSTDSRREALLNGLTVCQAELAADDWPAFLAAVQHLEDALDQ